MIKFTPNSLVFYCVSFNQCLYLLIFYFIIVLVYYFWIVFAYLSYLFIIYFTHIHF